MAELSVDIQARFGEVNSKALVLAKNFDKAEENIKDAGQAARSTGKAFKEVADASNEASEGVKNVGKNTRNMSAIVFQAGQAVSDFAVAGILGAANNLEFLAFQLGLGAPVMIGLTALTTGFIVFGDEILNALDPAINRLKEVESGLGEVLKLVDGGNRDIPFLSDQIPAIINELEAVEKALKNTEREARAALSQGFGDATTENIKNVSLALADVQGGLAFFREEQEKALQEAQALGAAQRSETLELNQVRIDVIRVRAEELGLAKEIEGVSNQKLLRLDAEGKIESFLAEMKEKQAKAQKDVVTDLQRAERLNARLLTQLEGLRSLASSRYGAILQQNDALRDQIAIVKRLNEERLKRGGALGDELSPISGQGIDTDAVTPLNDLVRQLNEERNKLRRELLPSNSLRQLDDDVVDDIEAQADRSMQALRGMREEVEDLNQSINSGLVGAFSSLAVSIGNGDSLFDGLRESIGSFAVDLGRTVIGFGITGESIKQFITNPLGAIVAGGSLIALGTALKRKAESQTQSFVSGGGGRAFTPAPDPRQGRDGRFQRNTSDFQSGFTPLPPFNTGIDVLPFEFRLNGEDLVASNRRTSRRQDRTRASGTRSSTSARG